MPVPSVACMYDCTHDILDRYEWDPTKEAANRTKHGVAFLDATAVLEDERTRTIVEGVDGEHRFVSIGFDAQARLVVVVWTWRGHRARLISARRATPSERAQMKWNR